MLDLRIPSVGKWDKSTAARVRIVKAKMVICTKAMQWTRVPRSIPSKNTLTLPKVSRCTLLRNAKAIVERKGLLRNAKG